VPDVLEDALSGELKRQRAGIRIVAEKASSALLLIHVLPLCRHKVFRYLVGEFHF